MSEVESRIARGLVVRGQRTPVDPSVRHGTKDVAAACNIGPNGIKCQVCRRAFPDAKKRQKINLKSRRTSSCMKGAKGHPHCWGWRFAAGSLTRDPNPCECPCHADGRGRAIPTFDEYRAHFASVIEEREQWRANNPRPIGTEPAPADYSVATKKTGAA